MLRITGLKEGTPEKLFLRSKYQDVFWALRLRFSMCFQFVIGSVPPKNARKFETETIQMVHHS